MEQANLEFSSCIIAADTHLEQEGDSELLERLLSEAKKHNCPVVFLGDIVNLWFESNRLGKAYGTDFTKLKQHVSDKTPGYFIPGNRDFLAARVFTAHTGLTVLPEQVDLTIGDTVYHLLHGDQIYLGDRNYRIYRRLVRNGFIRGLLNMMPDFILRGIASLLERDPKIPEETKEIPLHEKRFRTFVYSPSTTTYICGHIHRTMQVETEVDGNTCLIQSIGSWVEGGSEYIFIDQNGIHIKSL